MPGFFASLFGKKEEKKEEIKEEKKEEIKEEIKEEKKEEKVEEKKVEETKVEAKVEENGVNSEKVIQEEKVEDKGDKGKEISVSESKVGEKLELTTVNGVNAEPEKKKEENVVPAISVAATVNASDGLIQNTGVIPFSPPVIHHGTAGSIIEHPVSQSSNVEANIVETKPALPLVTSNNENPAVTSSTSVVESKVETDLNDVFKIQIDTSLSYSDQLKSVKSQQDTLNSLFSSLEVSQELYESHSKLLADKMTELQDLEAKEFTRLMEIEKKKEELAEIEAMKTDPDYAAYYERFEMFDSSKSGEIELRDLTELVVNCGYNFSENLLQYLLVSYFEGASRLNFRDFIRLLQFVLVDLDAQLKEHITPSIVAVGFKTLSVEDVLSSLIGVVEYDESKQTYDFSKTEQKLAELYAYDVSLVKETEEKQLVKRSSTTSAAPASDIPDKYGFDSSDETYLLETFNLFLKSSSVPNKTPFLSRSDLGHFLRALGLNPSENELQQLFATLDRDGSGKIDFDEFKQYFSVLFHQHSAHAINVVRLTELFNMYDSDGSGQISVDEFKAVIKKLSPNIAQHDLNYIIRAADINNDKNIDLDEFLEFLNLTDPISKSVRKKIIRSSMLTPEEYLAAFNRQPTSSRLSVLGPVSELAVQKPSARLLPKLNADGLSWFEFGLNSTGAIRESCDDVTSMSFKLKFNNATGVPITVDEDIRKSIKSRILRVCLYDDTTPVSNVYTVQANWNADEEDVWYFDDVDLHWNECVMKTKRKQTKLFFELCIIVEPELKLDSSKVYKDHFESRNRSEICCAFTYLDIVKEDFQRSSKSTDLVMPLKGGSLFHQTVIKPEEVLARRSGLKSMFGSKEVRLELNATLIPNILLDERSRDFVNQLPLDYITMEVAARSIRLYRELLADNILRNDATEYSGVPLYNQAFSPLSVRLRQNVPLQIFLQAADQQDVLHCFCKLWEERRFEVSNRKDDQGKANKEVKLKFAEALMDLLPVLASISLPLHRVGDPYATRITIINLILKSRKTFEHLNMDNLTPLVISISEMSSTKKEDFGQLYHPFFASNLMFDPLRAPHLINCGI